MKTDIGTQQVGFDVKKVEDYDEEALLEAIRKPFPESTVLKKPSAPAPSS